MANETSYSRKPYHCSGSFAGLSDLKLRFTMVLSMTPCVVSLFLLGLLESSAGKAIGGKGLIIHRCITANLFPF